MANPSTTHGKVVLVPFPFDDLSATKLRPAVCLTEPIGVRNRRYVGCGGFHHQPRNLRPAPTDIALPINHPGFPATRLAE